MYAVPERIPAEARSPYRIPFVRHLDLDLDQAVTLFVCENGSGKSTLLEAIADLADFAGVGGGRDDVNAQPPSAAELAACCTRASGIGLATDSSFARRRW